MRRALNGTPRITTNHGTPGFGHFNKHAGYDYGVNGATVVAPETGTVVNVYRNTPGGGNIVELRSSKYDHRFLHLKSISVNAGQKVAEGAKLGVSGATGQVTGPHLHHDTRLKGTPWNAAWSNYVDWESIIKQGDDMYKGKSAESWYKAFKAQEASAKSRLAKLLATRKELAQYKTWTKTWRLRYQSVYSKVKAGLGKYLGR